MTRVRVIDSHTGGEPTRVVVDGAPDLGRAPIAERLTLFRDNYDNFRSAVVNEPRGSDVVVGAVLLSPHDPRNSAGVIFFNNVGYLGMCGHGTIGVIAVMNYLGLIEAGQHAIETPVGVVKATLASTGEVTVENVPSYRYRKGVEVDVPGLGAVRGDIAWGGNWFFLVDAFSEPLLLKDVNHWTTTATLIREALDHQKIRGEHDAEIDHIELFGPSDTGADSRNFVLCPGMAYDRSPCGTGTSAKLACLAADGKLSEGAVWRQESIIGSEFQGSFQHDGDRVRPSITGRAYVNADASLLLDSRDPFCWGIRR